MSKGNGKTVPPMAEMAEVLGAVNARMTEGMTRQAEFVTPGSRLLSWNPAEDITPYELACALMVLIVGVAGGDAFEVLAKQPPEVARHFADPPNEPA